LKGSEIPVINIHFNDIVIDERKQIASYKGVDMVLSIYETFNEYQPGFGTQILIECYVRRNQA
jgi:hypothetical protein